MYIHEKIEQSTKKPGHQHIHGGTRCLPPGIPDTPDGTHNTQALSRRGCQVPGGRSAGLPTADRLTRVIKRARCAPNLALCYEHVTASKQFSKSEGSSHILWRPESCGPHTNATHHKRSTHANATGAEDSPGSTPGPQQSLFAAHQQQQ